MLMGRRILHTPPGPLSRCSYARRAMRCCQRHPAGTADARLLDTVHRLSLCSQDNKHLSSFSLVFSLSMAISNRRSFHPIANQNLHPLQLPVDAWMHRAAAVRLHLLQLHAVTLMHPNVPGMLRHIKHGHAHG